MPARQVHQRAQGDSAYPLAAYPAKPGPPHRAWRPLAAAITFVLVVVVGGLWGPDLLQDLSSDYHTTTGQLQRVTLADGTAVHLNTNTAIALDVRRVRLLRGEAYYEVARAAGRPFVVEAGSAEMRVTGTAFSVAKEGGKLSVTVAEGRVEVVTEPPTGTPVAVTAGQAVRYEAQRLSPVEPADLKRALAWRNGQIVFVQEPLMQVIEQVNRYRRGRIMILDPAIGGRRVTGVFAIDRLDTLLDTLERSLGVKATHLTDYLVLLR